MLCRKRFFNKSLTSNHGHLFTTLKWYWRKDDHAECQENTLSKSSLQGMNHSKGPSSLTPDPILLKNVIGNFWDNCGRTKHSIISRFDSVIKFVGKKELITNDFVKPIQSSCLVGNLLGFFLYQCRQFCLLRIGFV